MAYARDFSVGMTLGHKFQRFDLSIGEGAEVVDGRVPGRRILLRRNGLLNGCHQASNIGKVRLHQVLGTEWGFLSSASDKPRVTVAAEENDSDRRVIASHRRGDVKPRRAFS